MYHITDILNVQLMSLDRLELNLYYLKFEMFKISTGISQSQLGMY